ncbi:hypothetical protein PLESTF_000916500 [Pleodorina starrii]|nr:hypothetical protein PLESTF_000916500 [Pleodorina starrii]
MLSPRPSLGSGLRGVAKHATTSRFATGKSKKAQRALCTVFEESVVTSSPLFAIKAAWLQSPNGRTSRRTNAMVHPALGRLRLQEFRDTPKVRKATPIKDRQLTLRAAFGRHRMQGDLDALADELGTCQLQSALKAAGPAHAQHNQQHTQPPGALELKPLALMQDD